MSTHRRLQIAALAAAAMVLPASPALADGCRDSSLTLSAATAPRVEAAIACLVNQERAARGRRPVALDRALRKAARAHTRDMHARSYFDHISPGGKTPVQRARAAGYKGGVVGENIAGGADTAAGAMRIWMGSAGHRRNILSASTNALGVGAVAGGRGLYTQVFGRSRGAVARAASASCGADAELAIAKIGKARTEKAMVCVFNEWLRRNGRSKPARADAYVREGAIASLRDRDLSIPHMIKRLREAGFFRSGGGGFMRCAPLRRTPGLTPRRAAESLADHAPFVFDGPHRHVGIAINTTSVFLVVGRRGG